MTMPIIACRELQVKIDDHLLLDEISFDVEPADYLVILGANGSGKSTLLRCLLGIQKLSQGTISLENMPLHRYSQKKLSRQISYVPQSSAKTFNFSVEHFIRMARYPYHTPLSEWQPIDEQAFEQAMVVTNTTAFRERQMHTLSGGEAQRVLIAAALCQQTPIMLLDEPTSYLDPHHQVEVHQLIQRLNKEHGITIIEVSHDINHASQHAKRIITLKQGRLLWAGNSDDLMQPELLQQLYQQAFILLPHPQTGRKIALPDETL